MHGVIACDMQTEEGGDYWSVGNLISVVHEASRLVGVVCELMTADQRWNADGVNQTLVKIELSGEIIDEAAGQAGVLPRHSFVPDARRGRASHPRRRSPGDLFHSRRGGRRNRPPDAESDDSRRPSASRN